MICQAQTKELSIRRRYSDFVREFIVVLEPCWQQSDDRLYEGFCDTVRFGRTDRSEA